MFVAVELFEPFAKLLAFFYSVWPSYGGAIALFTLTIMIVLTPLTLKGTRSMMTLQALQPEMKKIQAQYKDDRQKLNEELLKFYKENNINPLGGCLPLLVQLPVFIILYNVLRGGQRAHISHTIYSTPEAKKRLETQAREAEARAKSGAPQKGFFKQLLGDVPQVNKDRAGTNGGAKPKPGASNKPPAARSNG